LVDAAHGILGFRNAIQDSLQEFFLRDVKERIRTHAGLVVRNFYGIVPAAIYKTEEIVARFDGGVEAGYINKPSLRIIGAVPGTQVIR
jgi:hypothetical protein